MTDSEKTVGLTDEQAAQIMALRKVERDLNKNMKELTGDDNQITISDVTRTLAREFPEILKLIDAALDEMEAEMAEKKEKHG